MLHLYQSNRLETLLELLAAVVAQPMTSPLTPETVIVQSKGMGRWIALRLAENQGICANIHFPLPAAFVWQLLRDLLGDLPKRSAFSPEVMVWRVMDWLSVSGNLAQVPRPAAYLRGNDETRCFELAWRIADAFDHYLVYRPDWISAWEAGKRCQLGPDEDWQAKLWKDLAAADSETHRAHLMKQLHDRLQRDESHPGLPERITLFGISSLPPVFLDIIQTLARHTDVCLFILNPCREEWGQIQDSREIARTARETDPDELYLETGNPLLASLGKQGRTFFDQVQATFPEMHSLFDAGEYRPAGGPRTGTAVLRVLQSDILHLIERRPDDRQIVHTDDRSLQIHVCHSPMREVEVLHDQLLAMLTADPDLAPSDIAVLMPDISTYAPYLEAVFCAREGVPTIPYAIADRGLSSEQPVLELFLELLDLPSSRFAADWVLAVLEHPAVLRRFDLETDDLVLIRHWVHETGIRWARDAQHKTSLGLPAAPHNTWHEGFKRLLLGYALPQSLAGECLPLFDDTLPYDDIEGARAQWLGQFIEFIEALSDLARQLTQPMTLTHWADQLNGLIGRLLLADEGEEQAIQQLRETLDLMRELAQQAGFERKVDVQVTKRWLARQLQQPSSRSGFLTGSMTFCTLVPMRSLPFKVVCLLGMNDGDFPREQHPSGFDLMRRNPRPGDRSRRFDDRYLFLETLLSARETLYISYVGRNILDNSERPGSVLVADLLDAVDQSVMQPDGAGMAPRIVTHHSLQPFSTAYFSNDPKRPGFSQSWLEASRSLGRGQRYSQPLFDEDLPEPEAEWRHVELDSLRYFFSNPARFLLRGRLSITLETSDAVLQTREPFGLDYFDKQAVRETVLQAQHQEYDSKAAERLVEAGCRLPHGGFGRALYATEQAVVDTLVERWQPLLSEPVMAPLPIHFTSGNMELTGVLRTVTAQGLIEYCLHEIRPRDLFRAWVNHLLLCQLKPEGVALQSHLLGADKTVTFARIDQPDAPVEKLLGYYWQGLREPLPFFIKSAYDYVDIWCKSDADCDHRRQTALQAAHKRWDVPVFRHSNFFGESENPYYQAVYRGADPLDPAFEKIALDLLEPMLQAVIEIE